MKNLTLMVWVSCALSCKSPREKYEVAARANLAALPGLEEAARSAPPIDEAATKALASISGMQLRYLHSNTLLIPIEELANPTVRLDLPMRLDHRSPTVDLADALHVVKPSAGAKVDTKYSSGADSEVEMKSVWQLMGELRYVLVVRSRGLREAQQAGAKTFVGGAWEGEVLVFELASRKYLGGFLLRGTNHSTVQTRDGRDTQNLAADLYLATRGNLDAKLRELIPGVGERDTAN